MNIQNKKSTFASAYCILVTVIGFIYIFRVSFWSIPERNEEIIYTVLGFILGTALTTAIAFVLGSSKSSADKTALLTKGGEK